MAQFHYFLLIRIVVLCVVFNSTLFRKKKQQQQQKLYKFIWQISTQPPRFFVALAFSFELHLNVNLSHRNELYIYPKKKRDTNTHTHWATKWLSHFRKSTVHKNSHLIYFSPHFRKEIVISRKHDTEQLCL